MKSKSHIFYGWYVVAAGFLIMGVVMGMFNNCQSQFMKPIAAELGVPRATISVGATITSVTSMAISFMAGKIFTRKDLGLIMKLSAFVMVGAYFSFSLVRDIMTYYICYFLYGVSFCILGAMSFSVIISNWFMEKRGTALGLASMGSGVFGMVFNYLAARWIEAYGWRVAYQIMAGCGAAILIPVILIFLKVRPSEMGLQPLGFEGTKAKLEGEGKAPQVEEEGYELKDAMRTPYFWAVIFCNAALGLASYSGTQTVAPHLTDVGYEAVFAGTIVSLYMGFVAVGKYLLGVLYDKFGNKVGTGLGAAMILLNVIGLRFCLYKPMLGLVVVGAGIGGSFGSIGHQIVTQNVFGRKNYAAIYGVLQGLNSVIGIWNPIIINTVFDKVGSYNPVYVAAIGLALVGGVGYLALFAAIEKKKKA